MNLVSSFVTDGASVNTGQKKSLWTLIENDRKTDEIKVPIMKIWCSVHRSALAWEKLTQQVSEVSKIIETCSSIATYFHQSGVRTKELKIIAEKENIKYVKLPKYFDVRWTEFTYSLLVGILKNCRILVKYFIFNRQNNIKDSKAVGFYTILTDINKLKLLCFLADLGYLYTRFQKQIQSDDLLIFDIEARKNGIKKKIVTEYEPSTDNTKIALKEIELHDKISLGKTKSTRNLYVSENRTFSSVRNDSIEHIVSYLDLCLDVSEWNDLKPLACLSESIIDEDLKLCHDKICPDFELLDLARILADKPHSADVERLISYYNVLKTCGRSSLIPETIKNSLYIKLNMCNVSKFDPHSAVIKWLSDKNRHNKVHPLAKQQEWYEGVFEEAKYSKTTDEDLCIKDISIKF
ncbi:Uncharacterized protein FWK35_00033028 [Aphis craccivora]|uniref:Uncharacterized protein n=1 Tax=Aphis craccivora TaxID=307492 RepID=A0A6G0W1C6_APHCR|nr:Uncharacterized protein FWK35_00033028 [Aphis craccivora]